MLTLPLLLLAQAPCAPRAVVPTSVPVRETFGRVMDVDRGRLMASNQASDLSGELAVFERDPASGDWTEVATVDLAGHGIEDVTSLSLSGGRAVVVSRGSSVPSRWTVHGLRRNPGAGSWTVEGTVDPDLTNETDMPVARVIGDRLFVGRPDAFGPFSEYGRVDIYERNATDTGWIETDSIANPDSVPFDDFGASVDFDGRLLVVGNLRGNGLRGRVDAFRLETSGVWTFLGSYLPTLPTPFPVGASVAIQGDTVVTGGTGAGGVKVLRFIPSTTSWIEVQELRPLTIDSGAQVGSRLAFENGYLIAASDADVFGADGVAFVYRLDPLTNLFRLERQIAGVLSAPPFQGRDLSQSVAVDGNLLFLGMSMPNQIGVSPVGTIDCDLDGNADSCEILLGQEFDSNANGLPDPCEETGSRYCSPATPNSSGAPGRMAVFGPPRTALLSIDLFADDLPPMSPGFFVASRSNQVVANPAVWTGDLCIWGSPISRRIGGTRIAGDDGRSFVRYNRPALPAPDGGGLVPILPGETWHFQYWYRDAGAALPSSFTDAVSVTFTLF
ncbi:MAG: hypothetical protein AAGA20_24710 [Planctomycetota bacterium]